MQIIKNIFVTWNNIKVKLNKILSLSIYIYIYIYNFNLKYKNN